MRKNWVEVAVHQLGGPSETVRRVWEKGVRVSGSHVSYCRRRGKIVDADLALVISELTGISPWLLNGREEPKGDQPKGGEREASRSPSR